MTAPRPRIDRARRIAAYIAAAMAMLLLTTTYGLALSRGNWPKGHPWYGVAVLSAALWFLVQTRVGDGKLSTNIAALLLPLLAAVSAGFLFGLW
ncbi:MAG: hypothetical protein U1F36_18115 [Planctomycetota bacterium]